jgi:UDP-N-acetylglucosamine--N-acetylmuramyl-(pentapeptide) pyrophosphoryl-undecaprenol N-acetylglucosamine transferase
LIHEANARPGLANKLGAKLTKNIFIAFEGARTLGGAWKEATNVGMPIKEAIDNFSTTDQSLLRKSYLDELTLNNGNKNLLIFGGSIGAKKINDAVAGSIDKLLATGWNVIHAVGGNNQLPDAQGDYRPLAYIHNMAGAYAAADFIISRSGAVTCAELAAIGKPALLVPLKIGNGEQEANAAELISSGQASMVSNSDFTAEWVKGNLPAILNSLPAPHKGVTRQAASKIGERALELIRVSA